MQTFHTPVIQDGVESETARQRESYDATKDIVAIAMCHVGDDRYLWQATLAAAPQLDNTVFHLYVDADANEQTGRKGPAGSASTGTDYMLSVVRGRGSATYYDPQGNRVDGPRRVVCRAGQNALGHSRCSAGSRRQWRAVPTLCPLPCRYRSQQPSQIHVGFDGKAFDHRRTVVTTQPRSCVCATTAKTKTSQAHLGWTSCDPYSAASKRSRCRTTSCSWMGSRWTNSPRGAGHMSADKRHVGAVKANAPKSGDFYVGFMMYDDSAEERIGLVVDDRMLGVVVANQNNNRTWLYWLEKPISLREGQEVELRAEGGSGKHGIINMLFLARATRATADRVSNREHGVGHASRPATASHRILDHHMALSHMLRIRRDQLNMASGLRTNVGRWCIV